MSQRFAAKPIAIAADHRGVPLKEHLKRWLEAHHYALSDLGTNSATDRVDAMDYALALVAEVKHGR
jgi:ribose 5-phosphate isomerase RpiB